MTHNFSVPAHITSGNLILLFLHLFMKKKIFNAYYMAGTVLDAGKTKVNKMDKIPAIMKLCDNVISHLFLGTLALCKSFSISF